MNEQIDPKEFDLVFGNTLERMMIAMEGDVNVQLDMIAQEAIEREVDMMYDDMVETLSAEYEMLQLAASSYDLDSMEF